MEAKRQAELERSKVQNEAQQAERREREIAAQIKQLINVNIVATAKGDEKYNFLWSMAKSKPSM